MGEPSPSRETKNLGANEGRNWRTQGFFTTKAIKRKRKVLAKKRRRRGRAGQRAARRQVINDRDRARRRELIITTHNVRTMAMDGEHGVGRAAEIFGAYQAIDFYIVCLEKLGVAVSLLSFKHDM